MYLAQFFSEREMFQATILEKIKTNIFFNNFFSENHEGSEMMWDNTVESDGPQMAT